ncbi:MAG: DUF86 domain-containing protein [Bacteroidales bacterium]|nr:DUF86 domain-containing protein [Bacteroidales bacterium]
MDEKNHQRIIHIKEAIISVRKFCQDRSLEDFLKDEILYSAVLHKFLVIGESVARIDGEFFKKYDYPWYKPRAFRNFIAHEYFQILPESIWETINNDLDGLEKMINRILTEEFHDDSYE